MSKKLYIKTYGCQMNVYDSDRMRDILKPLGYEEVEEPDNADMVILNTCHIREKAEEKVFSDLGRIKPHKKKQETKGKDMLIAVAGCVGQASGAEIMKRAPYVDMVMGPQTYHRLPEMIARAERSKDKDYRPGRGILDVEFPIEPKFDSLPEVEAGVGASAFLSVQEGCDKFCTFCCVPYTRGAEYSRPVEAVLDEARKLLDKGAKELHLLGQNVSAYHGECPNGGAEWGLGKLLFKLSEMAGVERLRYTTSHPRDMDDELVAAHRDIKALMPYLHLPVQAGSDRILDAMNRKHSSSQYKQVIDRLVSARPDLVFSSDFIVGFPGETEEDFQATLDLVKHVNYAQAYSFKYSPRPGTPGALMNDQVPEDLKEERLSRLQDLLNEQQLAFNDKFLGEVVDVLVEKHAKYDGQLIGRSPHMQSVIFEGKPRLIGQIVKVKINHTGPNSLKGEILTV